MEGDIECGTGHHEGLCQVGRVHEVILQLGHTDAVALQRDHLRHTLLLILEHGLHAEQAEDVARDRVALFGAVCQSRQSDCRFWVVTDGYHLIPVAGGAPVVLDEVVAVLVGLRLHGDGVDRGPFRMGAEFAHHPERQVDIGSRDDVARQS